MTVRALLPLPLLLVAAPAQAQLRDHDANAPVDVSADRIEVQDNQRRAVFAGSVRARQGGLALNAGRVTLAYARGSGIAIQRIDATGGVTVTNADQTARGAVATYDLNRRLITMAGGVSLRQGPNTVTGGRLVIDLASGRSVIDGGGTNASTAPGGRVSGRFTVGQ